MSNQEKDKEIEEVEAPLPPPPPPANMSENTLVQNQTFDVEGPDVEADVHTLVSNIEEWGKLTKANNPTDSEDYEKLKKAFLDRFAPENAKNATFHCMHFFDAYQGDWSVTRYADEFQARLDKNERIMSSPLHVVWKFLQGLREEIRFDVANRMDPANEDLSTVIAMATDCEASLHAQSQQTYGRSNHNPGRNQGNGKNVRNGNNNGFHKGNRNSKFPYKNNRHSKGNPNQYQGNPSGNSQQNFHANGNNNRGYNQRNGSGYNNQRNGSNYNNQRNFNTWGNCQDLNSMDANMNNGQPNYEDQPGAPMPERLNH
ncbi:hypothetical protein HII13_005164 [Brettanomyces bruxellensis]|nr:hypothetical protein HII13_005164 [Brettanomyces bruxellensis]